MIETTIAVDGNKRYELQAWPHRQHQGHTDYHCTLTYINNCEVSYCEYVVRGAVDETDIASIVGRMLAEGYWKLVPIEDIEYEFD